MLGVGAQYPTEGLLPYNEDLLGRLWPERQRVVTEAHHRRNQGKFFYLSYFAADSFTHIVHTPDVLPSHRKSQSGFADEKLETILPMLIAGVPEEASGGLCGW
jgi:hypothetical protein